ncbi:MAG: DUF4230 domain-containing protein [Prevotella sp.]|nr:DUF4230 domain-containing protein [Prevotella sp.]MBO5613678.1 DUF4230 domain-containing protein [Prevotella sp.]
MASLLFVMVSCKGGDANVEENVESVDTIPMMLQQIRQCSKLYTAEYKVHKIITHDDVVSLEGKALGKAFSLELPVGKRKVAIPLNATMKAYIDMSQIKDDDIRRDGEKIEIILPKPHVVMTSSSIDHDGVKQYVAVLRKNFSDEELTNYEAQGRKAIIADIPKTNILEMAKAGAANLLIPIVSQMGFKQENVTITFIEDEKKGGIAWILD